MTRIAENLCELVGKTPLLRLARFGADVRAALLGKLEAFNPGSSVKDRIGLAMIEAAEHTGELRPGGTIIEPTSGNTGIALAWVAAIKGYRLILTMPDTMSVERRKILTALGAEVVLKMCLPRDLARGEPHAVEVAEGAEQVDQPVADDGVGAGRVGEVHLARRAVGEGPELPAGVGVEAAPDVALVVEVLVGHDDAAVGDGEARHPGAGAGMCPEQAPARRELPGDMAEGGVAARPARARASSPRPTW